MIELFVGIVIGFIIGVPFGIFLHDDGNGTTNPESWL